MVEPRYNLTIYNTLIREKEPFVPMQPGQVGLYTCGPTVYNYAHIGNLRTYVFEDVLRRVLEYDGYQVKHVMNITDVGHLTSDADEGEDKMIKAMRREGKTPWDIAGFYTDAFFRDIERLNIHQPTVTCKATEHIPEMIELVQCLYDKGHAYTIQDGVYFDVATFPDYGKLSRQSLDDLEAGARIEVNIAKRHASDFALWKRAAPSHIMRWNSPWGDGFPGWHVECSAMSMRYLGQTFDIHCGGVDHIPIHHENEIAQSEGCTGKQFVRYWMHAEFLLINTGKMSKSRGLAPAEDPGLTGEVRDMGEGIAPLNQSGGFLTLQDVIDNGYDPLVYRYFCFSAKYRAQLNYTEASMQAAQNALTSLYDFVYRAGVQADTQPEAAGAGDIEWQQPYKDRFVGAVNDDLNMPGALAAVHELITEANRREQPAAVLPTLYDWDRVLGLRLKERAQERMSETLPPELQSLIDERQEARKARDFARADALRDRLREAGIEVEDTPGGVRWKKL